MKDGKQRVELLTILNDRTRRTCESCGQQARVMLDDGSTWCRECDGAARRMGY